MGDQSGPKPTGASEPPFAREPSGASIDLYWLPLGAGGHFVRLNGRVYESIQAYRERRLPLDLYHSALKVRVPEGRFIIETAWPIPDADGASRGVVVEGPVGSRRIAQFRLFRYEVRRWRDGVIPDVLEAVASPQRLSDDPQLSRRVLDLVSSVPALFGAGMSLERARCGTRTRWSRGSSLGAASQPKPSGRRSGDVPPAGRSESSWPDASVRRRGPSAAKGSDRSGPKRCLAEETTHFA
jgi:hypothetical protein